MNAAVAATPRVSKFGATSSFGVGDGKDPYVRSCRAECMLAVLLLHVDGADVAFGMLEAAQTVTEAQQQGYGWVTLAADGIATVTRKVTRLPAAVRQQPRRCRRGRGRARTPRAWTERR